MLSIQERTRSGTTPKAGSECLPFGRVEDLTFHHYSGGSAKQRTFDFAALKLTFDLNLTARMGCSQGLSPFSIECGQFWNGFWYSTCST